MRDVEERPLVNVERGARALARRAAARAAPAARAPTPRAPAPPPLPSARAPPPSAPPPSSPRRRLRRTTRGCRAAARARERASWSRERRHHRRRAPLPVRAATSRAPPAAARRRPRRRGGLGGAALAVRPPGRPTPSPLRCSAPTPRRDQRRCERLVAAERRRRRSAVSRRARRRRHRRRQEAAEQFQRRAHATDRARRRRAAARRRMPRRGGGRGRVPASARSTDARRSSTGPRRRPRGAARRAPRREGLDGIDVLFECGRAPAAWAVHELEGLVGRQARATRGPPRPSSRPRARSSRRAATVSLFDPTEPPRSRCHRPRPKPASGAARQPAQQLTGRRRSPSAVGRRMPWAPWPAERTARNPQPDAAARAPREAETAAVVRFTPPARTRRCSSRLEPARAAGRGVIAAVAAAAAAMMFDGAPPATSTSTLSRHRAALLGLRLLQEVRPRAAHLPTCRRSRASTRSPRGWPSTASRRSQTTRRPPSPSAPIDSLPQRRAAEHAADVPRGAC